MKARDFDVWALLATRPAAGRFQSDAKSAPEDRKAVPSFSRVTLLGARRWI